jgi:hypothetical protein
VAEFPRGKVAAGSSRHRSVPALICSRAEMAAFLAECENGGFNELYLNGGIVL